MGKVSSSPILDDLTCVTAGQYIGWPWLASTRTLPQMELWRILSREIGAETPHHRV